MKKPKVFISGPMNGYENYNVDMFYKCQQELIAAGFAVFNPAWLSFDDTVWTKGEMMSIDICALSHCDAICLLPNASKSNGSLLEQDFANRMGIPVLWYLPDSFTCKFAIGGKINRSSTISKLVNMYGGGIKI